MSLELWNTIFAAATFAVIAATAIAALVQLRHLRSANQLSAMLKLMEMWDKPDMQSHIQYMRIALQPKLKDQAFLAQYRQTGVSRTEHPELLVADFWEQIGSYVKYGLIDARPWLDAGAPQVRRSWDDLKPAILSMRERFGPSSFENFEYLAVQAALWLEAHPDGAYPSGMPRMDQVRSGDPRESVQSTSASAPRGGS